VTGPAQNLVFGAVELRLDERRLLVNGQPVGLGSRGFDLLKALVNKRDRVVSKGELLDEVWPGLVVEENNLQVQISGLRRVLGASAIATVAGLGYRFTLVPGPADGMPGPAPAPVAPTAVAPWAASKRVLVADDNKVNRLLLCRSLELMGHQVSSAENGRQALEMLQQHRYDLVLLDIAMPEMDGFELLRRRACDAALGEVPVIVTSAIGGVDPVARCIELGADDFLHKPVDPVLLRARVESSLVRKQWRDQQSETLRRLMLGGPRQAATREDACVLVACLHDLQALRPAPGAEPTMELLSHWSTLMLDTVDERGGELARYSGDSLMALFATPEAAQRAALEMVEVAGLLNDERRAAGQVALRCGIGIARGPVVVGAVTSGRRTAFACLGAPVQAAARLAEACGQGGPALLMDDRTRDGLPAT